MKKAQLPEFKRAYGATPDEVLMERFEMSKSTIARTARQLGLAKDKRTFPGTRKMPRWTDHDRRYLRTNYPDTDNLSLARELNRSVKSILAQAESLGLRKSEARLREMGKANVALRRR